LEYYLLLLAVCVLLIVALTWASSFSASQKETRSAISGLVANVTNSTLAGLGEAGPLSAGSADSPPLLALEIGAYEPYWTGQPAVFIVRIWNRGGGIGKVRRLSISVEDPEGRKLQVGPSLLEGISVPFSYSSASQFAPNATGTHTIRASMLSEDGHQAELSKEVLVLGGG